MVTDDIGEIIAEGFGGEIVRDGDSQEQQSNVIDLTSKTEKENARKKMNRIRGWICIFRSKING